MACVTAVPEEMVLLPPPRITWSALLDATPQEAPCFAELPPELREDEEARQIRSTLLARARVDSRRFLRIIYKRLHKLRFATCAEVLHSTVAGLFALAGWMALLQLHSKPLGVLRHLHADKAAAALLAAFHRRGETALARRALSLLEDVAAAQATMNLAVQSAREASVSQGGEPCPKWMKVACLHPRAVELLPWARAALIELHCNDGELGPALALLALWGDTTQQQQQAATEQTRAFELGFDAVPRPGPPLLSAGSPSAPAMLAPPNALLTGLAVVFRRCTRDTGAAAAAEMKRADAALQAWCGSDVSDDTGSNDFPRRVLYAARRVIRLCCTVVVDGEPGTAQAEAGEDELRGRSTVHVGAHPMQQALLLALQLCAVVTAYAPAVAAKAAAEAAQHTASGILHRLRQQTEAAQAVGAFATAAPAHTATLATKLGSTGQLAPCTGSGSSTGCSADDAVAVQLKLLARASAAAGAPLRDHIAAVLSETKASFAEHEAPLHDEHGAMEEPTTADERLWLLEAQLDGNTAELNVLTDCMRDTLGPVQASDGSARWIWDKERMSASERIGAREAGMELRLLLNLLRQEGKVDVDAAGAAAPGTHRLVTREAFDEVLRRCRRHRCRRKPAGKGSAASDALDADRDATVAFDAGASVRAKVMALVAGMHVLGHGGMAALTPLLPPLRSENQPALKEQYLRKQALGAEKEDTVAGGRAPSPLPPPQQQLKDDGCSPLPHLLPDVDTVAMAMDALFAAAASFGADTVSRDDDTGKTRVPAGQRPISAADASALCAVALQRHSAAALLLPPNPAVLSSLIFGSLHAAAWRHALAGLRLMENAGFPPHRRLLRRVIRRLGGGGSAALMIGFALVDRHIEEPPPPLPSQAGLVARQEAAMGARNSAVSILGRVTTDAAAARKPAADDVDNDDDDDDDDDDEEDNYGHDDMGDEADGSGGGMLRTDGARGLSTTAYLLSALLEACAVHGRFVDARAAFARLVHCSTSEASECTEGATDSGSEGTTLLMKRQPRLASDAILSLLKACALAPAAADAEEEALEWGDLRGDGIERRGAVVGEDDSQKALRRLVQLHNAGYLPAPMLLALASVLLECFSPDVRQTGKGKALRPAQKAKGQISEAGDGEANAGKRMRPVRAAPVPVTPTSFAHAWLSSEPNSVPNNLLYRSNRLLDSRRPVSTSNARCWSDAVVNSPFHFAC